MQRSAFTWCQEQKEFVMRNLFLALILVTGLLSCNKEKFEEEIEGNYTGTFQRVSPTGFYGPQQVSLHLKDNSFSGESANARNPAICHGSWEPGSSTINFKNACMWTADFDWTLILDGEFKYELNGMHLSMWKTTGEVIDRYELEKAP